MARDLLGRQEAEAAIGKPRGDRGAIACTLTGIGRFAAMGGGGPA